MERLQQLFGRQMIFTDEKQISASNVIDVLNQALIIHEGNRSQIKYLWQYYKGNQPILGRVKDVRPEIMNIIVENRANEIVTFKSGYLMGEPVQYVSRSTEENLEDSINQLNDFCFAEEKAAKDKKLSDWFHIFGTAYRMILPNTEYGAESPFEILIPVPWNTFVVYSNELGSKPLMGVTYVIDNMGVPVYSIYTRNEYFEVRLGEVMVHEGHVLGDIPIVEYPLNIARIGAFEIVIMLLDAINLTESNRVDGVEQFIQALMLFHNVDISTEDFDKLREMGALKFKDIDPTMKGEVDYLINNLNQAETQVLMDHMYDVVLTICGMPNRQMSATSTSDNVGSVIMRDGWSSAESRAKDTELMFRESERRSLKLMLNISRILTGMNLKLSNIDIKFTRRNYENIYVKAQVLDLMLKNPQVHPLLAFIHSGLFTDPESAYAMSKEYYDEYLEKQKEMMMQNGGGNDSNNNTGNDSANRNTPQTREQSRTAD